MKGAIYFMLAVVLLVLDFMTGSRKSYHRLSAR